MILNKENYKIIIIGCIVLVLGFVLMSGGGSDNPNEFNAEELFSFRRITFSPLLIIIGYMIVLFGILKRTNSNSSKNNASSSIFSNK